MRVVKLLLRMVLQLVIIIVMINVNTGRTVMASYREHRSPTAYVFRHQYDHAVESEDDNDDDTNTDNIANYDILSSVLDIFNSERMQNKKKYSQEDNLLSSIYEDILDPVIKESIERKKQSTRIKDSAQVDDEKYLNYGEEIGTHKIKEKDGSGLTNDIFSNILSSKTRKKVGKGISIIHSAIPNYQILLLYVVYVIGGTLVMSLPALL